MSKVDELSLQFLQISIKDDKGREWKNVCAIAKNFKTGSIGFHASEKMANPLNPTCLYQIGMNITLIDSKPKPLGRI